MSDILKLVYYTGGTGTEMTFDHNEVRDMVINTKQDYSIKNLQNRKPLLYLTSGEYRIFTITINTFYPDTITKLNALKSQTLPITLFYDFKNIPGSSACVMLDLKIPNYYSMGFWAAGKDIQLIFYEVQPSLDYITIPESNIVCATPNYALSLNGTDQYVYHAHNAVYNLAGEDCMLTAWIKTTDTEAYLYSKQKTGTNGYALYVNASGVIGLVDGGGNFCSSGVTVNTALGKYISAVLDVSALKCYWFINGAYVTNVSYVALVDNTVDFVVGAMRTTGDSTGASGFLNGHVDEVRIFKFGNNGLYINGTFGTSGIIRVGTSTGSVVWLDSAPTTALIYKLYKESTYSLTNMGFSELDNANRTERSTNGTFDSNITGWIDLFPTSTLAWDNTNIGGNTAHFKCTKTSTAASAIVQSSKYSYTGIKYFETSVDIYIPSVDTITEIRVALVNQANSAIGTYTSVLNAALARDTWVTIKNVTKTDGTQTGISAFVYVLGLVNTNIYYLDNFSLKEVGEVTYLKMEQNLTDTGVNGLSLTGIGTPTYTPHID